MNAATSKWAEVEGIGEWHRIRVPGTFMGFELFLVNLDAGRSPVHSFDSQYPPPYRCAGGADCLPTSPSETTFRFRRRVELLERMGKQPSDCADIRKSSGDLFGGNVVAVRQSPPEAACPLDLFVWTPRGQIGPRSDHQHPTAQVQCDGGLGVDVGSTAMDGMRGTIQLDVACATDLAPPPSPPPLDPPSQPSHPPPPISPGALLCTDACHYAGNGACQDGGAASIQPVSCELGTDCTDCGGRVHVPPPPPVQPSPSSPPSSPLLPPTTPPPPRRPLPEPPGPTPLQPAGPRSSARRSWLPSPPIAPPPPPSSASLSAVPARRMLDPPSCGTTRVAVGASLLLTSLLLISESFAGMAPTTGAGAIVTRATTALPAPHWAPPVPTAGPLFPILFNGQRAGLKLPLPATNASAGQDGDPICWRGGGSSPTKPLCVARRSGGLFAPQAPSHRHLASVSVAPPPSEAALGGGDHSCDPLGFESLGSFPGVKSLSLWLPWAGDDAAEPATCVPTRVSLRALVDVLCVLFLVQAVLMALHGIYMVRFKSVYRKLIWTRIPASQPSCKRVGGGVHVPSAADVRKEAAAAAGACQVSTRPEPIVHSTPPQWNATSTLAQPRPAAPSEDTHSPSESEEEGGDGGYCDHDDADNEASDSSPSPSSHHHPSPPPSPPSGDVSSSSPSSSPLDGHRHVPYATALIWPNLEVVAFIAFIPSIAGKCAAVLSVAHVTGCNTGAMCGLPWAVLACTAAYLLRTARVLHRFSRSATARLMFEAFPPPTTAAETSDPLTRLLNRLRAKVGLGLLARRQGVWHVKPIEAAEPETSLRILSRPFGQCGYDFEARPLAGARSLVFVWLGVTRGGHPWYVFTTLLLQISLTILTSTSALEAAVEGYWRLQRVAVLALYLCAVGWSLALWSRGPALEDRLLRWMDTTIYALHAVAGWLLVAGHELISYDLDESSASAAAISAHSAWLPLTLAVYDLLAVPLIRRGQPYGLSRTLVTEGIPRALREAAAHLIDTAGDCLATLSGSPRFYRKTAPAAMASVVVSPPPPAARGQQREICTPRRRQPEVTGQITLDLQAPPWQRELQHESQETMGQDQRACTHAVLSVALGGPAHPRISSSRPFRQVGAPTTAASAWSKMDDLDVLPRVHTSADASRILPPSSQASHLPSLAPLAAWPRGPSPPMAPVAPTWPLGPSPSLTPGTAEPSEHASEARQLSRLLSLSFPRGVLSLFFTRGSSWSRLSLRRGRQAP